MSSRLNGRLEKLEAQLKAFSKQTLWVDLFDNRVRIDIIGARVQRGEEITFDSVIDCIVWVESQIAQFEKVTGLACISDISQMYDEGWQRMSFDRIFENAPSKTVVFNLHGLQGRTITLTALVSWWHSIAGPGKEYPWKEEAERRLDLFLQYLLEEREEEDIP